MKESSEIICLSFLPTHLPLEKLRLRSFLMLSRGQQGVFLAQGHSARSVSLLTHRFPLVGSLISLWKLFLQSPFLKEGQSRLPYPLSSNSADFEFKMSTLVTRVSLAFKIFPYQSISSEPWASNSYLYFQPLSSEDLSQIYRIQQGRKPC